MTHSIRANLAGILFGLPLQEARQELQLCECPSIKTLQHVPEHLQITHKRPGSEGNLKRLLNLRNSGISDLLRILLQPCEHAPQNQSSSAEAPPTIAIQPAIPFCAPCCLQVHAQTLRVLETLPGNLPCDFDTVKTLASGSWHLVEQAVLASCAIARGPTSVDSAAEKGLQPTHSALRSGRESRPAPGCQCKASYHRRRLLAVLAASLHSLDRRELFRGSS